MKKAWFYILTALASGSGYGSAIQEDVRALSEEKIKLWPATLYGSLEELLEFGWIREIPRAESLHVSRGRERFYEILPAGREALANEINRLEALARLAKTQLEKGVT